MASISHETPAEGGAGGASGGLFAHRAARWWLGLALFGQGLFLLYIVGFYLPPVLRGDISGWSQNRDVIHAYVAGDFAGNIQFGLHVLAAAVLTLGGILQLSPRLRARYPAVHRWNGRLFVVAALLASLGGLWLVWVRESRLNMASAVSISLNAALILLFVGLAWKAARGRDFASHRRWAMRAFLAVSGVWFLRIGMMAYGLLGIGVFGVPKSSGMLFFTIWSFGSTLVPLLLLELWFRIELRTATAQRALAFGWAALILLTSIGVAGAAMVMWLPALLGGWGLR